LKISRKEAASSSRRSFALSKDKRKKRKISMEIFRPYAFDKILFFTTLILIGIGLIMVFSSSGILASEKYQQPFHFLIHQVIGVGLGLVMILLILPIRRPLYQNPLIVYWLLLTSLLLLALCLFMPAVGNTNRWIYFQGLRFQPSELSKISMILFLSLYLARKKDRLNEFRTLLFPLSILFLFILLIIKEPDYGTAFLLLVICSIILFIGGIKLRHFLLLGIVSSAIFLFYLLQADYRINRIFAFFSPTADPQGSGFQIIQSKLAVGSGGLFGASIGESIQKLYFLPCAHTDYIYAILGEEFGLGGTLAVLFLFTIVFWRGLVISLKAPNLFSQLAAAGLTMAIFFQALLNVSVVLGLGPPTGVPLPLISFGRSSLICTLLSIGILLHISQRKGNTRRKK
jgi:cell division protein FtsW